MGTRLLATALAVTAASACMPRDADVLGEHSSAALTADAGFDIELDGNMVVNDAFDDTRDAMRDAPPDTFVEAGNDAMPDAPHDAFIDAGSDAMPDAPLDAFLDAGSDAMPDAPADALTDAGSDAMPDAPDAMPDAGSTSVTVDISPPAIDFGEVRIGAAAPDAAVTITNRITSPAPAQLTAVALRVGVPALALAPPATPVVLVPGQSTQATLTLETGEEVDLAGEHVDVSIGAATRSIPVTGKVVTPSSRIVPAQLALGTACVGSTVTADVTLVNDGTATLAVEAPSIAGFTVTSPQTPGALAPAQSLTATLSTAATDPGPLESTLLWRDDVPTEHAVPVSLTYIVSGTAISPAGLDFGSVPVDGARPTQHLSLQNCDASMSTFEIVSLRTKRGALAAWTIAPRVGTREQLTGREARDVAVSFDPSGRGRYEAELTFRAGDTTTVVQLIGDSTGRDFDRTSFYACACSGGEAAHGWPLALTVLALRRRRNRRVREKVPLTR